MNPDTKHVDQLNKQRNAAPGVSVTNTTPLTKPTHPATQPIAASSDTNSGNYYWRLLVESFNKPFVPSVGFPDM